MPEESTVQRETLFGHPVGLYTLFFAEMWERFSYYGMRALLVLYMIKGFLGYSDDRAYGVYGAYTALVYAIGFIGGMFADRLLGQRRAAVLGGLLMAAGHLMMTLQNSVAFYMALGLLITGNGFFKPNISTIVGSLYPAGSPRRDGGFTIYYMGVNLGATLAPLVCGYVGERYGWHLWVWLGDDRHAGRTCRVCRSGAIDANPDPDDVAVDGRLDAVPAGQCLPTARECFCGFVLAVAGVVAFVALGRGGLPENAGAPPDPALLLRKIGPFRIDVLDLSGRLIVRPDLRAADTAGCNCVVAACFALEGSLWLTCLSRQCAAHRSNGKDCSLFLSSLCFRCCFGRSSSKRVVRWRISRTEMSIACSKREQLGLVMWAQTSRFACRPTLQMRNLQNCRCSLRNNLAERTATRRWATRLPKRCDS